MDGVVGVEHDNSFGPFGWGVVSLGHSCRRLLWGHASEFRERGLVTAGGNLLGPVREWNGMVWGGIPKASRQESSLDLQLRQLVAGRLACDEND